MEIEIPFGAKDSELKGWEYTIPEGMEAVIENGKVIVREKESQDEKIRKEIKQFILDTLGEISIDDKENAWLVWLEKYKDIKLLSWRAVDECKDIPDGHYVVVAYNRPGFFALDTVVKGKLSHPRRGDIKATGVFYIPNADENCMCIIEKQKVNTEGDFARGYDCGYECCLNSHGAEWFEKQKEQPADAKSERVIKAARRVLNNWLDGTDCPDVSGDFAELEYAIREYDGEEKQKPTEKQDYSGLTDFERAIHRGFLCAGVENVPVEIIKETAQDCLAHIEQKPAEWSEEDEYVIDKVIEWAKIVNPTSTIFEKIPKERFIERLKSLRSQHHWKPSEEQMLALQVAAITSKTDFNILTELFIDLKKL